MRRVGVRKTRYKIKTERKDACKVVKFQMIMLV